MKIELTPNGYGSRVFGKDGNEIRGITDISVHASVGKATRAEISFGLIKTTSVECDERLFCVGPYRDVIGVVLKDGSIIKFDEK